MKAQILKIAGVKSEAAFYKKFPSQEAFMKVHGKEFKKAQKANAIEKAQTGFNQGFGMNPQSQYQNTFSPNNNFVPGNYNVSTPNINPMNGFQNVDPFAMQNYGQQWAQNNPLPTNNPNSKFSNGVFQEDKSVTGGLGGKDYKGGFNMSGQQIGSIINGISNTANAYKEEKKQVATKKQTKAQLDLFERLSNTPDVNLPFQKHVWSHPEDSIASTDYFNPSRGTGYNILASRNGSYIPRAQEGFVEKTAPNFVMFKNGGEISNTYAPNTLYDDLDQVKQYAGGGMFSGNYGGFNSGIQGMFGNNAGSSLGNLVPGPAGMAVSMIGGMADNMFGPAGQMKSYDRMNKDSMNRIMGNTMYQNLGFHASRKDGGYVSNDWTPQVIAKFGDHTAEDYYDYAHEYDTLRSGGHLKDAEYSPISQRGMQTMAQGGEFQTHWGGNLPGGEGVKPVSYNPFSKGQGLTYNAYGQSHDEKDGQGRSGIGISVLGEGGQANDDATVEMEYNEPIIKMADGGNTDENAVIFGNLTTNEEGLKHFGLDHKKYGNTKFKHAVNKIIVPEEQKINKQMANLFKNKNNDILAQKTDQIKNDGYMARLKQLAADKENLANYQDSIHEAVKLASRSMGKNLSTENFAKGIYTTKLAKGELPADNLTEEEPQEEYTPISRNGRIAKAQTGKKATIYDIKSTEALPDYRKGQHQNNKYYGEVNDQAFETLKQNNPWFDWSNFNPANPADVTKFQNQFNVASELVGSNARINVDGELGEQTASAKVNLKPSDVPQVAAAVADATDEEVVDTPNKKFNWAPVLNAGLNMFKKPYNMPLSPEEFRSELYALSTNQPKNLYGPHVHSMLETPFKQSFDPTRNAITSQARAAQRYAGNNPAAQAAIFGEVADKLAGINSQELAANQELYSRIANNNINTINKDMYANTASDLDIADKIVKSEDNTRKETLNALSSIDSKILANRKANREMNIASAMFPDYTFNNSGQLVKNPRYIEFDTSRSEASALAKDKYIKAAALKAYQDKMNKKNIKDATDVIDEENTVAQSRKGGKLSLKNKMNGSIVKAYKTF